MLMLEMAEVIPNGKKVLLYRLLGDDDVTVGEVAMHDPESGTYGITDNNQNNQTTEMLRPGLDFVVPQNGVRVVDTTEDDAAAVILDVMPSYLGTEIADILKHGTVSPRSPRTVEIDFTHSTFTLMRAPTLLPHTLLRPMQRLPLTSPYLVVHATARCRSNALPRLYTSSSRAMKQGDRCRRVHKRSARQRRPCAGAASCCGNEGCWETASSPLPMSEPSPISWVARVRG